MNCNVPKGKLIRQQAGRGIKALLVTGLNSVRSKSSRYRDAFAQEPEIKGSNRGYSEKILIESDNFLENNKKLFD